MTDRPYPASPAGQPHPARPVVRRVQRQLIRLIKNHTLIVVFAGLLVLGGLSSDYFLTLSNMNDLMRSMAEPGLLALGVTFVLLVGRIDLSMGAAMIFCPVFAVTVMTQLGGAFGFDVLMRGNMYIASAGGLIGLSLLAGIGVGLVNAAGVLYARVAAFIMTLAMMQALRGLNYVLTDGHAFYIQIPNYTWIGTLNVAGLPFSFLVYVACLVIAGWVLHYTKVGHRIYAVGGNESAARLAGIKAGRWIAVAFAVNGFLAAVAGIVFTARLQSVDAPMAAGFELTAIALAVVGGVSLRGGHGSPYRAFLGTLVVITLLKLFGIWGLATWYQTLATGVVIIAVVVFDRFVTKQRA